MKKLKTYILLIGIGILLTNTANAQFFVELGSGYAMPIKNIDWLADKSDYGTFYGYDNPYTQEYIYEGKTISRLNTTNGIFFSGELGYRFKKNFVLSLNFQYLNSNMIKPLYKGINYYSDFTKIDNLVEHNNNIYYKEFNYITTINIKSGRYFSFSPKFSYIFTYKKLEIQPSIGFSYINSTAFCESIQKSTEKHYALSCIDNIISDTIIMNNYTGSLEYKIKYCSPLLFSAYFSLGFSYKFNKNISAFFLTEFNGLIITDCAISAGKILYQKVTQDDQTIYESNKIIEGLPGFARREKHGPGYTNVNFSIGVRYTFNKKQKND